MKPTTRRQFLRVSTALAGSGTLMASAFSDLSGGDVRIAELATAFWQVVDDQVRYIDEAERIGGVLAYELDDTFRTPYEQLVAREKRVLAALAKVRPNSLAGLIAKMRVACVCKHLNQAAQGNLIEEVFFPALTDLERLAG